MGLLDGVNDAKRTYLSEPWAGKGRVVKVSTSLTEKDYNGSPYVSFLVLLENGVKQEARFWTPKSDDDETKRNGKLLRIKEFLENAGVSLVGKTEEQIYTEVIGKELYVAFGKRSYIGKEKTGRPAVKSGVDFAFSNSLDKPFTNVNLATLTKNLKPEDWAKLNASQQHWDATNNPMGSAPTASESMAGTGSTALPSPSKVDELDDDLPF
jgi:hypothetical protein